MSNRKVKDAIGTTVDVIKTANMLVQLFRVVRNLFTRNKVCPKTGRKL